MLHSKPGSANAIVLDFHGFLVNNTAWSSPTVSAYHALPYDLDGDPTTFSSVEQQAIVLIWARVREDYYGFDVDVTTVVPAVLSETTGHVLVTKSVDALGNAMPYNMAGGISFIGVFNTPSYA